MISPAIVRWWVERWRESPGYGGAVLALGTPLLFYLPLGDTGAFNQWRQGAAVVGWIAALALAIALGRDTGRAERWHVWLFQKGTDRREYALSAWLFDLLVGFVCLLWWALAWLPANAFRGEESAISAAALFALMTSTYVLSLVLLFMTGAAGSSRGVEVVVLAAFLSLLSPVLTRAFPPPIANTFEILIPPFLKTTELYSAVRTASGASATNALLHLLAYVGACLGVAFFFLGRRRPQL